MKYIQGHSRDQITLFPVSLNQSIAQDNEARVIDLFVSSLNLKEFGFKLDFVENGRPAYHPADLLKLYIYGYLNKVRSSRDLEKETKRNIEVMWLLKGLSPDHNTISNFRRDNAEGIKQVFKATVSVAKHFSLIGGTLLAGDSTKFRAQNSKKNNYNQKKIDRHVEYIDKKLQQYTGELATADGDAKKKLEEDIQTQQERKEQYKALEQQLADSGQEQISTSDPDSRQMIIRGNITEVAYNAQTTVDDKHNLLIDYLLTNSNDSKAMGEMVQRAAQIVENTNFTSLYDKGYHTGSELKKAQELGVETIVAIPALPSSSHAPHPAYNISEFIYHKQQHTYTCPQGHTLTTNGNWYNKHHRNYVTRIQQFKTSACKGCPAVDKCTKNTRGRGRVIERSEYMPYVEKNRENVESKQLVYRRRQSIVEHPYGTIKRQWGYTYISTKKGMVRASADAGLIFASYNLRRLINILGITLFAEYLAVLVSCFFHSFALLGLKISPWKPMEFPKTLFPKSFAVPLYQPIFIHYF
jgi:transposase